MAIDRLNELRIDRGAENPPRRRRAAWILAAALLVAGLALLAWWLVAARPTTVRTVAAVAAGGGPGTVLDASGYVTARRQATVSSKVTGKVVEVLVEEGMEVAAGQVLARLDPATPRHELALAAAELEAARKALAETEVQLAEARRTLARTRDLAAQGIANQADLDAAQAAVDGLAARLAVGRQQIEVAARQAALARQAVEDTIIRAPFAGVAISKDAQPGEMISPVSAGGGFTRTGICTIVDMSSLEIEVDVNESYIQRVHPGQRVEATLDAYPDWKIPAHVITIVPAADRQKATVKVRIGFDRLDPRILPDMGVKVAFLGGAEEAPAQRAGGVRVPRAALRGDAEHAVVYRVRDGRLERRAVGLAGSADDDPVEIAAGLEPGDRVVVAGPADLRDGQRVVEEDH